MSSTDIQQQIQSYLNGKLSEIKSELQSKYNLTIELDTRGFVSQSRNEFEFSVEDIEEKTELGRKNLNDLRDICKHLKLRYSGKKSDLVDRIWGVKYPDQAPVDAQPKKRGRKSKVAVHHEEQVQTQTHEHRGEVVNTLKDSQCSSVCSSPIQSPHDN